MPGLWIALGVAAILIIWLWGSYNGLVHARNIVKNAWAQIDVQLKRRFDLIPNLIETPLKVIGILKGKRLKR